MLTVYGIETVQSQHRMFESQHVATVPTVYGIETNIFHIRLDASHRVTTVLTVSSIKSYKLDLVYL